MVRSEGTFRRLTGSHSLAARSNEGDDQMTLHKKGSLFAVLVLVLTGIFFCFGTAHSQSVCTLTFDELDQLFLEAAGLTAEAFFQMTAAEWQQLFQSDFGQCICRLVELSSTGTIIDDEDLLSEFQACTPEVPPITEPSFTLTVEPATIDEGSGNVTVTVSTGGPIAITNQTVTLSFAGTATRGTDYNIAQPTLTLVEGQTSVSTTVTIVDDRLIETSETIVITGTIPRGELGTETVDPATITILDDDEPEFSLTVDAVNIVEDGGSAEVTVSTGGATFLTDQTIALSPAGTATEGTDYAILEATLVLPARQTSVSTAVTAIDDTVVEGDETIEITARHADEMVGAGQTITILDDDEPEFSLTVDAVNIVEDGGSATVTVSTGEATFRTAQTITLVTGGTATEGEDYTIAQQTLTLSAGETSVSTTVTATDDTTQEGNETLVIEAQHAGEIVGGSQTITIIDNDMAQFTLTVDATSIDEDGGSAEVTVSTGEATFRTAQTITLVTDGTATQGTDYAIAQQTLTLSAGETSVSTTVTATDDTVQEGDETLVIEAQHDGEAIGAAQTITITDNDMAQFTLTVDATSIDEDGGSAEVTVSTGEATFRTAQTITLVTDGTATQGTDYAIAQQTLTLSAGETSVSTTVTATDDTVQEGDETLVIEAQHDGEAIGAAQTITITDNDMAQFTLTVDATSIDEDGGSAEVTVSTGEATFRTAQTITLAIAGTATQGTDYAIAQQTLTLSAGETSVSTTVTATDDTVQEGDETLVIEAQHDGEAIGAAQTITITDNDMAQFTLTVDATSINEDGGSATVTVRADGGTFEDDQTITLAIAGTATQGTDYAIAEQTLTLPAGETSVSTTVTAKDDTVQEGSEETITITAQLAGVAIGVSQTITITEAEPAPPPTREVVEETLEAVVTSTISNVTTNIGTRFSAARSGTAVTVAGRRIPFAESVLALSAVGGLSESALFERDDGERQGRDLTLNKLLETSSFQVALAANGEGTQAAQPLQSLTVWGRVDRMFFDKESNDANRYDGDLSAGYLGLDTWLDDRWLIGVAASVTKVKAGYGLDTGGKLDLSILGVHPYLRLAVDGLRCG